jgi:hypothetical protein
MIWVQRGQSDLAGGLNPQGIEPGARKDSQVFPELESPRDIDSDVSGGRGLILSLMWLGSVGHAIKEHYGNSGHCI